MDFIPQTPPKPNAAATHSNPTHTRLSNSTEAAQQKSDAMDVRIDSSSSSNKRPRTEEEKKLPQATNSQVHLPRKERKYNLLPWQVSFLIQNLDKAVQDAVPKYAKLLDNLKRNQEQCHRIQALQAQNLLPKYFKFGLSIMLPTGCDEFQTQIEQVKQKSLQDIRDIVLLARQTTVNSLQHQIQVFWSQWSNQQADYYQQAIIDGLEITGKVNPREVYQQILNLATDIWSEAKGALMVTRSIAAAEKAKQLEKAEEAKKQAEALDQDIQQNDPKIKELIQLAVDKSRSKNGKPAAPPSTKPRSNTNGSAQNTAQNQRKPQVKQKTQQQQQKQQRQQQKNNNNPKRKPPTGSVHSSPSSRSSNAPHRKKIPNRSRSNSKSRPPK